MKNYVIVLGSNLCSKFGNSEETLQKCVDEIRLSFPIKGISESKWYISSSFLDKREPVYLNVGLKFNSNLEPLQLLKLTSLLERKYERKREGRWKPRTCDIDIILCDQLILPNKSNFERWLKLDLAEQKKLTPRELILPHPRLQERSFFLKPLIDLQPNWIHPFLKQKAKEMLDSLPSDDLQSICELKN